MRSYIMASLVIGVLMTLSSVISFSQHPEAEIHDCPIQSDEILSVWKGTEIRCGCRLRKKKVFPPAKARWASTSTSREAVADIKASNECLILTPKSDKNYSVSCTARDIIFGQRNAVTITGHVRILPEPTITLTVGGLAIDEEFQAIDGHNYSTGCRIEETLPTNSIISLTCPGAVVSGAAMDLPLTATVNAHQQMDNKRCLCEVTSPIGGTKRSSSIFVNVVKGPELDFTIDDQETEVEYKPGDVMKLLCSCSRTTDCHLDLLHENSTVQVAQYDNSLDLQEIVTCTDSGTYTCKDVVQEIRKDIDVYVECPAAVDISENSSSTFKPNNDSEVLVEFGIVAHPPPKEFHLFKLNNRVKRSLDEQEVNGNEYNVTVKTTSPGHSRVRIRMYGVRMNSTAKYELLMKNGVGKGGRYRFKIVRREPEKQLIEPKLDVNPGVIAGGVIGGLVVILLLCGIYCFFRMRELEEEEDEETGEDTRVEIHEFSDQKDKAEKEPEMDDQWTGGQS